MASYSDMKVSSFEIGLSKMTGKKIKEVKGYLSRQFGDVTFKITKIVMEDDSEFGVEGEHDFPYLVTYPSHPQPNFDDDMLEQLCQKSEAEDGAMGVERLYM